MTSTTSDVLVIGSGAAGLTAALNLATRFHVTVLAKGALNEGSTAWAQGGIAAVLEPGDSVRLEFPDQRTGPHGTLLAQVHHAGQIVNVQQVEDGLAVPVREQPLAELGESVRAAQADHGSFRTPAHGPGDVQRRASRRAAREDETPQGRHVRLELVDPPFQPGDVPGGDGRLVDAAGHLASRIRQS